MKFDTYVLVRLVRPADFTPLPAAEEMRVLDAHLAHVADLHERGLLLAAGPPVDPDIAVRGIGIMTCSLETAMAEWAQNPGVAEGRFVPECMSWMVPAGMIADGPGLPPRSIAEAREEPEG